MKKFYVAVVFLCMAVMGNAQNTYWVGTAGASWNSSSSWSATSGGAPGAAVPNGSSFNVIFDANAVVNVDIAAITLNSLTVTNSNTAKLVTTIATTLTLNSSNAATPALKIDAGSRLEDSCDANVPFSVTFANNAVGLINGTWYFSGSNVVTGANGATFDLPEVTGLTNRIDINGSIVFKNKTVTPAPTYGAEYLFFNAGSTFWLDRDAGNSPKATWDANATIRITGVVNFCPSISVATNPGNIGNLVIDCPNIITTDIGLNLVNHLIIKGNLQVLNTNNQNLIIASTSPSANVDYQVNGNFNISGASTKVVLANATANKNYFIQVNGNFNLSGGSFSLRDAAVVTVTLPTILKVGGNFNHTGGTFLVNDATTSTTTELFAVELNGSAAQTVSSATGTIDNAQNQVTLRLNNAAGATLLTPLSVGKISWNSTNKGKLTTTTANVLKINNTSTADNTVVNAPSGTGFVSGPVQRAIAGTGAYVFPTGKGSKLRYIEVIPAAATASVFTAEYFGIGYTDLSTQLPLQGVSGTEYWNVVRSSGSNASIRLNLSGALPGATAGHTIVVAHYVSSDWLSTFTGTGTSIVPGNSTSGTAVSDLQTSFGLFTFGATSGGSLPIHLLTFDAKRINSGSAAVNWSITDNSTPDHFEILRSADGRTFSSIGSVAGIDNKLIYEFRDNTLPIGTTYYRLRLLDKDGTPTLSKIIAVLNGANGVLITSMMPTLVTDRARLNVTASEKGTLQLVVSDSYGRIIQQQVAGISSGNQEIWLNLRSLAAGTYQVTGYMNGERTTSIRFLKQ